MLLFKAVVFVFEVMSAKCEGSSDMSAYIKVVIYSRCSRILRELALQNTSNVFSNSRELMPLGNLILFSPNTGLNLDFCFPRIVPR